jgi:hypothetical protein
MDKACELVLLRQNNKHRDSNVSHARTARMQHHTIHYRGGGPATRDPDGGPYHTLRGGGLRPAACNHIYIYISAAVPCVTMWCDQTSAGVPWRLELTGLSTIPIIHIIPIIAGGQTSLLSLLFLVSLLSLLSHCSHYSYYSYYSYCP